MKYLDLATFDFMDILNFNERPFRAKFIPAKVWKDLDNYRNDSKGLSNYFKKWRTRVQFRPEPNNSQTFKEYVAAGGEYDPNTEQCTLHIYSSNFDKHKFTDRSWTKFKYRVIQIQMHELVHFMQYNRRIDIWNNYVVPFKRVQQEKKNNERKYLSEFDEIQAYAHCVYMDFKSFRPNIPVEELLGRAKHYRDSKTLHYFLKTFDYDYKNNVAIPKIMQQVIKWDRKYSKAIKASCRPK
jgi:hypothetical protein